MEKQNHPFLKITQFQQLSNSQKPLSAPSKAIFQSKFVFKFTDKKEIHSSRNDKFNFSDHIKSMFTSLLERTPQTSRSNREKIQFDIRVESKSFSRRQKISKSFQIPTQKTTNMLDKSIRIKSVNKICPQSILQPCKINSMRLSQRKIQNKHKQKKFNNRRRNLSRSIVGKQIQRLQNNVRFRVKQNYLQEKDLTLTPWMKQDDSKLGFL